ncbi:hypothetical protein HC928_02905 [bacterium]|nr:hypothetical protein [bacterium]
MKVKQLYLKYPPRIEFGSLQVLEQPLATGNEIACFCATIKGERKLLPDWGLPDFIFKSDLSSNEIEAILVTNIQQFFPDVSLEVACFGVTERICKINYEVDESVGIIEIII